MTTEFISLTCILHHLTPQDDPEAWKAILGVIGEEFAEQYRASVHGKQSWFLRIGACSHWWRPHQARWTQAGGFAWPAGYSGSRWPGPPELDSSVILSFDGEHWKRAEKFSGNKHVALRVTVPTRTAKHKQAAVHTVWSKSHEPIFYGFRNIDGRWISVAASDEHKEGQIIDVL
jgi:hypothetical protein